MPVDVPVRFALNHMTAPQLGLADFFALARKAGISDVEIRNDLPGLPILDGTPASAVRKLADDHGVTILTINALQKFNRWSAERAAEAAALADYAAACGSQGLILVSANDGADNDPRSRLRHATESLAALKPILSSRGVTGFVECLGFEMCSLRSKREAVEAIKAVNGGGVFRLTHDTFHHTLAGEADIFPAETGLVHISGVEDPKLSIADMRDSHRVLVGPADRLGNMTQISALRRGGYAGPLSFEPFAPEFRQLADPAGAVRASMDFVRTKLAALAA